MIRDFFHKMGLTNLWGIAFVGGMILLIPAYVHIQKLYYIHAHLTQELEGIRNAYENEKVQVSHSHDDVRSTIKQKIDVALASILGKSNYIATATAKVGSDDELAEISVHVTADQIALANAAHVKALPEDYKGTYLFQLQKNIENELSHVLRHYNAKVSASTNFIDFLRPEKNLPQHDVIVKSTLVSIGAIFFAAIIFWISAALSLKKQKVTSPMEKTGSLEGAASDINLQTISILEILNKASPQLLADYLVREPIRAVALMLYSMNSNRAAAMVEEWPLKKQIELFVTFSRLHSENSQNLHIQALNTLSIEPYVGTPHSLWHAAQYIFTHLRDSTRQVLEEKIHQIDPAVGKQMHNFAFGKNL